MPDLAGPGHADEQHGLGPVEHQAVWAHAAIDQAFELVVRGEAEDATVGPLHVRLTLVGEVEIAIGREMKVVATSEGFRSDSGAVLRDVAAGRVELHDAVLVVGNEDLAVVADFQPVGVAVVVRGYVPFALWAYPEDLPERNIDDPKIALAVERRAFEEAIRHMSELIVLTPVRIGIRAPKGGRHFVGDGRFDFLRRRKQGHMGKAPIRRSKGFVSRPEGRNGF